MARISSKEIKELQKLVKHDNWHEGIDYEKIRMIKQANYPKRYWPKGKSYVIKGLFNEMYIITKEAYDRS